ncbi:FxSxx-COOH system tetratricopeptide repeat protein, partial [Kitasatospora sp. NPDC093558]|uniref:FxSxx-COOH system tetratricopeptide repeat protein n=1 Tax=Kitasatospora sp. NPDC093558 TaxID=3155201 RepID=UPI00341229D5
MIPQRSVVRVEYLAEDRPWADWIGAVLELAGFRVVAADVDRGATASPRTRRDGTGHDSAAPDLTVAVLSDGCLRASPAQVRWEAIGDPDGLAAADQRIILVRVGEVRLTAPLERRNLVDLVGMDEGEAVFALLHAVGRIDPLDRWETELPRWPGGKPRFWSVPGRNPSFTGRSDVLEELREQLVGGPTVVLPTPTALQGLGGVGKTQVALEYAHRYKSHYDLVWWIDAGEVERVPLELAKLADRLGLRAGYSLAETAERVREALRRGIPTSRWLLIFDGADEPIGIRRYFPYGAGHVLVTSRNRAWSMRGGVLGLDTFTREESVEHLCRRVAGLARQDAERVADVLGDLPLAVEIAAAWLAVTRTPAEDHIAQVHAETVRALQSDATWDVSIARLREQCPAAVRLLQLCAFLAPGPISLSLVYSGQMIRALLPYDEDLTDVFMLGKVIRAVSRYALAEVDFGAKSLEVHRLVGDVVRSRMTEDECIAAMHDVHHILVGARPPLGDTDNPANWPRFEPIWPHLAPSRAQDCEERETRELLIDQVRYLWQQAELDRAQALAEQLKSGWTQRLVGEQGEVERRTLHRQVLSLDSCLANILHSQGSYLQALELDEATLAGQQELLGRRNPYVMVTAGSLGADLRALGRFQDALELDLETYGQLRDVFGDENSRTLRAANNLAIDYRMAGDSEAARDLDQETYDRRLVVLGPRHPDALTSLSALARDRIFSATEEELAAAEGVGPTIARSIKEWYEE